MNTDFLLLSLPRRILPLLTVASLLLSGCGYSEEEWQAQLAKYEQLNAKYAAEQQEKQALQKELDETKQRVDQLQAQLREMGVDMDALNAQLQQAGTEKQQLAASLEELRQALDEYKARAVQLERIKERFELLRTKLQKLVQQGLKVEIRRNRMVIRLPGDVLFASGRDKLQDNGKRVIATVAEVIRKDAQLSKRYFQVAGHTDNKPLKGGRFGDNWGLSMMRARQVLLELITAVDDEGGGLDPERLHAAGYGSTDPVESNDTTEGREQNRRVELVLMPDLEEMLDLKSLI